MCEIRYTRWTYIPGPLAPPRRIRPRRKMMARSYSFTICERPQRTQSYFCHICHIYYLFPTVSIFVIMDVVLQRLDQPLCQYKTLDHTPPHPPPQKHCVYIMAKTERLQIEYNVINTDITVLIGLYSKRGNRLVLWPDLNAHPDGEGQCEQDQQEGEQ